LFPVEFSFVGISELNILRAIEQDVFQKVRHSHRDLSKRLNDVCDMHCLNYSTERQRYLLTLHGETRSGFQRKPYCEVQPFTNDYYVFVECRALHVAERYREGWRRAFGNRYLDVMKGWDEVWPVPRWGVNEMRASLEETFTSQR